MPSPPTELASGVFGAGPLAPYDRALTDPQRTLYLHEYDKPARPASDDGVYLDVGRFLGFADDGDADLIMGLTGPVLDIGCGPGRLVKAVILAGHVALGIDVSTTAVRIAQNKGLPVLRRSVFHELPGEGAWGTALLIDGNIGIGGDPRALLERCAGLVRGGGYGRIVVETHEDPDHDRVFHGVVVDDLLRRSLPFPWAIVGARALREYAAGAGLALVREWSFRNRCFAEYTRS